MLKALLKFGFFTLFLLLLSGQFVQAETKVYRSDSKMPFVKMMLSMMSAMGILDRIPANGGYGGYGQQQYSNPYARALAMRGFGPSTGSSWLQSPSGANTTSPLWGSPSWGVLPYNSYATNAYSPYGYYDESDLSGWVNEPLEESAWNSRADIYNRRHLDRGYLDDEYLGLLYRDRLYLDQRYLDQQILDRERSAPAVTTTVPLVQNFTYNVPANTGPEQAQKSDTGSNNAVNQQRSNNTQANAAQQRPVNRSPANRPPVNRPSANKSPLAKLAQPGMNQAYPYAKEQPPQQKRVSPLQKRYKSKPGSTRKSVPGSYPGPVERACVTEFCGLKIPNLNGLWVGKSGEMLGIKNHRYLWSDGKDRYLTGQMKIENEYLVANVDDHDKLMRFKYKLSGDLLLTMQPDGTVREFVRTSRDQYLNQFRTY